MIERKLQNKIGAMHFRFLDDEESYDTLLELLNDYSDRYDHYGKAVTAALEDGLQNMERYIKLENALSPRSIIVEKQEHFQGKDNRDTGGAYHVVFVMDDESRHVITIAKKYLLSGTPFEDLLMAGSLGITRAADVFDASLGYRFISFATWYIECEVRKAAYDHLRHKSVSLDDPIDADDCDAPSLADFLHASSDFSSDWQLRYDNTLTALKSGLDKHYYQGAGDMLNDYLTMRQKGYPPSDFAVKHHLSEPQMQRFLHMLRLESYQTLKAA